MDIFIPYDDADAYSKQVPLRLQGQAVWDQVKDSGANPYIYGVKFDQVSKAAQSKIKECFDYFNKKAA